MDQATIDTPVGRLVVSASSKGLTRIAWSQETITPSSNPYCLQTVEWIEAYFTGKVLRAPILDDSDLTRFQSKVCQSLMETGWGQTTTYAKLATKVGNSNASRAVGSVMAMNPWPILVPCHRVLNSNGGWGNYSAAEGPKTKRWLLDLESE